MLIIVEGNEGTGKTTLINEIIKKLPCVVVKYPKEVKNTRLLLEKLIYSGQTVICDRSFITDIVYRLWDKKSPQMSLYDISALLHNYSESIKVIFCENKNSFNNSQIRGEDFITDKKVYNEINENFARIKTLLELFTEVKIYNYDYEYDNVDNVINFIGEEYVD